MIDYSVGPRVNPQNLGADPKFAAFAQAKKTLNIDEFADHIEQHGCVHHRGDIKAVLSIAQDCLKELLLDGYSVDLGDIGRFSVSLGSIPADTREEFTAANISKVNVNWHASKRMQNLRKDASFRLTSTRIAQASILSAEKRGNKSVDLAQVKEEQRKKGNKTETDGDQDNG